MCISMPSFVRFPYNQIIRSKADHLIDNHLSKSVSIEMTNDTSKRDYCFFTGGPITSYSILKRLDKDLANYINIDKGYLSNRKKNSHWRLTYNNLQQTKLLDVPDDRLKKFNIDIKPWKTGGDYILVLAPNPKPLLYYTNSEDTLSWCMDIKSKLLKYTDRKIFFRFKESRKARGSDSIEKYLENCYAVVTLQSLGCVETIMQGIPTINLAPSCLDCLYKSDISMIESIPKPDNRYEWLKTLSYSQFTIPELENGYALKTLQDLQ